MPRRNTHSLSMCDELIAMLQAELDATRVLRRRLECPLDFGERPTRLCDRLWNAATETVRAVALLQAQVCEPERLRIVRAARSPSARR